MADVPQNPTPAAPPAATPVTDSSMAPQMPQGQAKPPKHHSHAGMWVLGIVMLVLILALVGVAIFLVQDPSDSEIATGDAQARISELEMDLAEVQSDLTAKEMELEELMDEEEVAPNGNFDQFGNLPTFVYPRNWQVVAIADTYFGREGTSVFINEEPIWFCDGCDGPRGTIVLRSVPASSESSPIGSEVVQVWLADATYSDVTHEEIKLENGILTKLSGHVDSDFSGESDVDYWIFNGQNTTVMISFDDITPDDGNNDVWELISSSLNFDAIQ